MEETVDIIREVVEGIDNEFSVDAITDNGDGTYTLTTGNTLHLQVGFPLTVGAVLYNIDSIVKDVSITISGASVPVLTAFDIYSPVYYHGTVVRVSNEMITETDAANVFSRTPFIYLREILEDNVNTKYSASPIKKTTDLQILILTQCNPDEWNTTDHYAKSIYQMTNLAERFIESCYGNAKIGKFENYTLRPHANFGVYVTDKGNTASIFVDKLSGVELNVTLPFKKQLPACNL
jgi:hypothetical protein